MTKSQKHAFFESVVLLILAYVAYRYLLAMFTHTLTLWPF